MPHFHTFKRLLFWLVPSAIYLLSWQPFFALDKNHYLFQELPGFFLEFFFPATRICKGAYAR
ncbi:MAG: hypothetical protein OXC40_06700 [Proteobacteria bacterium]|nr:hypothetical protein [Pseudomonadota bacterium]